METEPAMTTAEAAKELVKVLKQIAKVEEILEELRKRKAELVQIVSKED